MRRVLLGIAIALLAGAGLLELIEKDSGYVLISLGKTSVEMSFWVALTIVLLLLGVSWSGWRLLRGGYRTSQRAVNSLLFGHTRRAQKRTARGLIDFMEGNWKQAHRLLLRSVGNAETPLINYLAAARSAYEFGDQDEAFRLLHRAEDSAPGSTLAVALTQARMQLLGKKYEQCVATLERAKRAAPKHPVVLDLLRQVYVAVSDWQGLEKLLPQLRRYKVGKTEALDQLEQRLYRALLQEAGDQAKRQQGKERLATLEKQWYSFPTVIQRQIPMVATYVEQLIANQGDEEAELILRKTLQRQWDERLLRLYGKVKGRDVQRQLLTAESWLKERPGNAGLMLTLGRLCLRNQLWGRAREYFESSLRLQKDAEVFAELARLLAHLGEHEKSTEFYQQGLLLTTHGLPELPQPHLSS